VTIPPQQDIRRSLITIECGELSPTEIDDLRHSLQKSRYHFTVSDVVATGTFESFGDRLSVNLLNLHTTLLVQFATTFTRTKQRAVSAISDSVDEIILKSGQRNREPIVLYGPNGEVVIEIRKSTSGRRRRRPWTRNDILVVVGIVVAVAVGISAIYIPEIRRSIGRESTPKTTRAEPSTPVQNTEPSNSEPPKQDAPKRKIDKRAQKATTRFTGNGNIAGNNISGDNTMTGNNNQIGPTANAPYGIAIAGGTVTNPTVNNYGSPAVQLTWSVADAPAEAPAGKFAKAVQVKSNTSYSPIFIAIVCDSEIENLSPIGISMDIHIGYLNNDKKNWFLRIGNPPITPDSPLTVIVVSKTDFNVLAVAMMKVKQP
jgi:hypothetical protein